MMGLDAFEGTALAAVLTAFINVSLVVLMYIVFWLLKDYDHRWEWCRLLCLVEMKATFDESNLLCFVVDIVVKVSGVSPCRDQHNDKRIWFPRFLVAFLDPLRQLSSVWRITEHSCPPQSCISPSVSTV